MKFTESELAKSIYECIENLDDVYDYLTRTKTTYEESFPLISAYRSMNPWIAKYEKQEKLVVTSKEELIIKEYMEEIHGVKFDKSYLDWNRSHITGLVLELDGYNDDKKIAFEYNSNFYHSRAKQKMNDEFKKINCEENGVELIIFDDEDFKNILNSRSVSIGYTMEF